MRPRERAGQLSPGLARARLALILASATFSISITAVVPALPEISRQLDVSVAAGTWAFTGYLLASAALTPIVGHVGDIAGHRRILVGVLVVFALGALVSGMATNMVWLVVGRSLQGIGGAIIPLCFGIVRTDFPAAARTQSVALISATNGLGTGVGLLAGGALVDTVGFRGTFALSGVLAVASFAAVLALVPTRAHVRSEPFDVIGSIFLTGGLICLLAGVGQLGPSAGQVAWLSAAVLSAGAAVIALRTQRGTTARPIVDLVINLSQPVAGVHAVTLLSAAGGFSIFLLTPVVAQRSASAGGLGITAMETSALLFPGCLLMMGAGICYPRVAAWVNARRSLMISSACIAAGLMICLLAPGLLIPQITGIYLVLLGIGLLLSAAADFIVEQVPVGYVAETSAVNALARNVGNAVGAQACTIALTLIIPPSGGSDVTLHALYVAPAAFAALGVVGCARLLRRPEAQSVPE